MKTKSLSLLILLALCITISGVYAAWIYAETPLTAVHGHIGSFGLANAQVNNSKGTITVVGDAAHLIIDQTASNDYTANLVANGSITVKFTPSQIFADSNPDLNQITMKYKLVTTNTDPLAFQNDDGSGAKAMFTKFDTTTKNDIVLTKQTTGEDAGKYVATINAADLLSLIELNEFELDTYDKYSTFSTTLGAFGNIGVEVSES